MEADGQRQMRRQLRHDLIISALAIVSVGIGVYELLNPRAARGFNLLDALDLAIVGIFIVDFTILARRSGDVWTYAKRHWWELPSLIPITGGLLEGLEGVSLVRGLRLVRLARVVRLVRVLGMAARLRRVRRYLARIADRARIVELGMLGVALVMGGALSVYAIESPREHLVTFGDAIWWSLNVFTTVGLLTEVPLTTGGKVVASLLMVSGIAYIGVFTASLANAILKEPEDSPEDDEAPPAIE